MSWFAWVYLALLITSGFVGAVSNPVYRWHWHRRRARRRALAAQPVRLPTPPPRVVMQWCEGCGYTHAERRMAWCAGGLLYRCHDCRKRIEAGPDRVGFTPEDVAEQLAGDWTRPAGFSGTEVEDAFDAAYDQLMCHQLAEPIATFDAACRIAHAYGGARLRKVDGGYLIEREP